MRSARTAGVKITHDTMMDTITYSHWSHIVIGRRVRRARFLRVNCPLQPNAPSFDLALNPSSLPVEQWITQGNGSSFHFFGPVRKISNDKAGAAISRYALLNGALD